MNLTQQETFVLIGAIKDRMDALEDNIKDAQDELLLLQVMQKKIKATV